MVASRRGLSPGMLWFVVVGGMGLVTFLAVAGTLQKNFNFTYVALVVLGMVGFVLKIAAGVVDGDDEPTPPLGGDSNVAG